MWKTLLLRLKNVLQSEWCILSLLYTLSYGLILINNGLYYDDWVTFNQSLATRIHLAKEIGGFLGWTAYFHDIVLSCSYGIYIERWIIFISYFSAALFLSFSLKKVKEIDQWTRVLLVICFMLFPVNFSRVPLCTINYALCYAFFFMGLWLVPYIHTNVFVRLLALAIFLFSFSTNSLLVFYALIPLFIFYIRKPIITTFHSAYVFALHYVDFLILPIVFLIIKNTFFKPFGLYAGYNGISLKHIILSPILFLQTLYDTFFFAIDSSCIVSFNSFFSLIVLASLLFLYIDKVYNLNVTDSTRKKTFFFLLGVFIFFLGVFPYIAVEKRPSKFGEGRFQMLIPLGASFMLVYGVRLLLDSLGLKEKIFFLIYILLIIGFMGTHISQYFVYQQDAFKNFSLIENFKTSDTIKNHTSFFAIDHFPEVNAEKRKINFYEYNGLMKLAFGEDTRFMCDPNLFTNIQNYEINTRYPQYNMSNFHLKDPEYNVVIRAGKYSLSVGHVIKLLVYQHINPEKYKQKLQSVVSLDYIPIVQ